MTLNPKNNFPTAAQSTFPNGMETGGAITTARNPHIVTGRQKPIKSNDDRNYVELASLYRRVEGGAGQVLESRVLPERAAEEAEEELGRVW